MDKLVADGRRVTISNDGATIMRLLEIEHPAAKTLVDISMSQVRGVILYYIQEDTQYAICSYCNANF